MGHNARIGRIAAAFVGCGAACCVFALAGSARADVKIVSEQTLTGMEAWGVRSVPVRQARYFKGEKMREETEGRNVVHIYDAKNDKYYTVDRNTQTFSIQTLDEATLDSSIGLTRMTPSGTVTITNGGATQKIAGLPARNWTVSAKIVIKNEVTGLNAIDFSLEGEQWTSGAVALPSPNPRLVRSAYLLSTNAQKLFKPFYDKAVEFKGVPLSFDYSLSFQTAPNMAINGAREGTMEAHGIVRSVSTAKLSDALFSVPKGYKLVARISPDL